MTMPAGTYFVGDISLVAGDFWAEFCFSEEGENVTKDGRRFAYLEADTTVEARDRYTTNIGEITVRNISGHFGCIRLEDVALGYENKPELGIINTFHKPFEVSYVDGTINIGGIKIYTADE